MRRRVPSLQPPDSFHLSAAEGWLELGDGWSANEELEKIAPQVKMHPDVLEVRWQVLRHEECWRACVELAQMLTRLAPAEARAWFHLAYSVKKVEGGGLEAAVAVLKPGVEFFPDNPLFCFYLALYTAELHRIAESADWWAKGMEVAQKHRWINQMALTAVDDPELRPLLQGICRE